ncbi:Mannose-specific lectin [Thalictrum thalictroides]|uniref:Mannose-specific lectin n=1 Tax=Thalictrum thalictroides TaxID=46969 RepID=A0A7J6WUT0_THATH|nr:Mannose-specific lectin [Thalictrum thalictroides]
MASNKCAITFLLIVVVALNVSICCNANYVLGTREKLNSGVFLQNNNYVLIMQEDCNLVIYDSGSPVWATNTGGLARNCYCIMQDDGNLVVYKPDNRPIWASNTGGASGGHYVLVLQNDRNLVIYGPAIWAAGTNTANGATMFIPKVINANETGSVINMVTSTV